jgi:hypothetical protein
MMPKKDLGHGPYLSDREYDRKIIELRSTLPSSPTKEQDRRARRLELDLDIDHRLGMAFPAERREALWAIQEKVEKKRLRLAFKYILRKVFGRWFIKDVRRLTGFMVDEYAKTLTADELERFFDFKEGRRSSLPIDINQLKK